MTANKRTLVKLDDKVIKIVDGKRGLTAVELKPDELFEASVLEEGMDKLLQNDMNALANEAYQELKDGFKNALKANVLRIAGFENRWGNGYEVDHCNGRQSMMTEYLSSRVQDTIKTEIDALITKEEWTLLLKDAKKAVMKDAKDYFKREVQELMRSQVRELAQEFVGATIKQHITKVQKNLINEAATKMFGSRQDVNDIEETDED